MLEPEEEPIGEEEPAIPTREQMLEAIPDGLQLSDDVELDNDDPALTDSGRRACIAERRAGGRCTAPPLTGWLLCSAHGGQLDPRSGGLALAEKRREARIGAEETSRLARLGTRGVIADTFARRALAVRATLDLLLDDAERGDKAAARLLLPFLNQGLGLPTETTVLVHGDPTSEADLDAMSTSELAAFVAAKRPHAA